MKAEKKRSARTDEARGEDSPEGVSAGPSKRARSDVIGVEQASHDPVAAIRQAAETGKETGGDDADREVLAKDLAQLVAVPALLIEVQRALEPLDEETEALLQKPLTGVEETDVELLASQRVVLATRVGAHDQLLVKMRRAAALLERHAGEIEAFAEMAVRSVECAQEDLGLTLARIGSQTEVVSAEDEAAVITAAVLRGEQAGVDALSAIVGSAQALMQQIGDVLQKADEEGGDALLLMSQEQAEETKSMLRARLRVHDSEIVKLDTSCSELVAKIQELENALDDVQLELSVRRRQITRKNMQVIEHEREQAVLEESKGADAPAGSGAAADPNDVNHEHKEENHVNEIEPDGVKNGEQLSKWPARKLEAELSKMKAEYSGAEQREWNNQESFLRLISERIRFGSCESSKSSPPLTSEGILSSHTYRTLDAKVRSMRSDAEKNAAERKESVDKYSSVSARFAEAAKSEKRLSKSSASSDSAEVIQLQQKLSVALDAAEQSKANRDQLSLKYEYVKLDFGTDAVIKLLKESERCFESTSGLVSREVARLEDDLQRFSGTPSESWITPARERSDALLGEIELLSRTYDELQALSESVTKLKAQKRLDFEKLTAEMGKIKRQLEAVERETDALQSRLDGEVERSSVLESLVDRSLEHVMKERSSRSSAISQVAKVRGELHVSREATAEHLRLRKVCLAENTELTRSIELLDARKNAIDKLLETERAREEELRERASTLRAQLEKEASRPQMSPRMQSRGALGEEADKLNREQEIEDLRRKLNCSIVTTQPIEVVLRGCGHLFSRQCINNLISGRNRKCPICGERFGQDDARPIHLE